MRRAAILACLLGCGRIGFDASGDAGAPGTDDASSDDAPPDGASACVTFGAWSAPVHDPILSSSSTDWGPSLSHDGLTLVFASNRLGAGDRLFRATRATTTSAWSTPSQIAEVAADSDDPSLSSDGLDLYWGNPAVSMASRPNTGAMFGSATQVLSNTALVSIEGGPDISPDGLTLLFTGTSNNDGKPHMYETHRATTGDAWGPFQMPTGLLQIEGEQYGSYRGDLLEVIFNKNVSPYDLFAATRTTPTSAFSAAASITELDSTSNEVDPDLSDDGTMVFFASDRAPTLGSWDLWYATRVCIDP